MCGVRPRLARGPMMIQRPDSDGPPNLDAFFDAGRRKVGAVGAPVSIGTGRGVDGDSVRAARIALERARSGLEGTVQLCHCTVSVGIDAGAVAAFLKMELPGVFVVGRSVNKKDSAGTVEVLLVRAGAAGGIAAVSKSVAVDEATADPVAAAVRSAAQEAAMAALTRLEKSEPCTFMVFAHSPGAPADAARAGIDVAMPGVIAYGGPAVGNSDTGAGWALFGGAEDTAETVSGDVHAEQTVHVAAVPGSLSFLLSSVIKNWAQPAYTEPLSYMSPTYVDDAQIDLLTAIRYNDWDKFLWCIEKAGVDVNTKWVNKQNQIPLLAACARVRSEMIEYLIENGADVHHRNDGGFTAAMYTRMLTEYDSGVVRKQLDMLEAAGANIILTADEIGKLKQATNGRIVE